jgi:ATP-dependent Clp protease ATP-binding subunit ClpB
MIDVAISKLESETGENLMLTKIVDPEQIAEVYFCSPPQKKYQSNTKSSVGNVILQVVSQWTGIPVTRLGHNDKERLVVFADRLHQKVVGQTDVEKGGHRIATVDVSIKCREGWRDHLSQYKL